MDIKSVILESLAKAIEDRDRGEVERIRNRRRSALFVRTVAKRLRGEFNNQENVRVLSKDYGEQRTEFGLNELLYDILVCETGTTEGNLVFVEKALWQIESEFARDCREAIYDFNKLVLGSSEHKLFIGPQGRNENEYLSELTEPARHCHSDTFVALLPHPATWDDDEKATVRFWRFMDGWTAM